MPITPIQAHCSCSCGKAQTHVMGAPLLRFLCHCEICQRVYRKPYADIIAVRTNQISKPLSHAISFAKYKAPPAIKRGVCVSCQNPVVGFLPPLGLAFVPADNFPGSVALPPPSLHSFYHRRLADIDDALPKIEGYWASQWAISKRCLSAILLPEHHSTGQQPSR